MCSNTPVTNLGPLRLEVTNECLWGPLEDVRSQFTCLGVSLKVVEDSHASSVPDHDVFATLSSKRMSSDLRISAPFVELSANNVRDFGSLT